MKKLLENILNDRLVSLANSACRLYRYQCLHENFKTLKYDLLNLDCQWQIFLYKLTKSIIPKKWLKEWGIS